MRENGKRTLLVGLVSLACFGAWTLLVHEVDVQRTGSLNAEVGMATLNVWFHRITGVHMLVYTITDWLGLVPVIVCMCFGIVGLVQLVSRRSLLRVDFDLLLLGGYYVVVILAYLLFEMVPINYRPILIDGNLEASYPSSTTLLVLSVMPTFAYQVARRVASPGLRRTATVFALAFSSFMVIGRTISGVHWLTDIIGSVLLSFGLFMVYRFLAECFVPKRADLRTEASDGVW